MLIMDVLDTDFEKVASLAKTKMTMIKLLKVLETVNCYKERRKKEKN